MTIKIDSSKTFVNTLNLLTTLFPLKSKGASSRSMNVQKLKGEEKMPQMNEKTANLQ